MKTTQSCPVAARLLTLLLMMLLTWPAIAGPASVQENIDVAISPGESSEARVEAAKDVTERWQESLPVIIQNIDTVNQGDASKNISNDATAKLVPLTDLLDEIVGKKDGSVQKFNQVTTGKTVDLLAETTGSADRDLRLNASNILYTVVGDDNLCVILHRLRDPNLGYSGQVNLLQIAISGTSNASRENVEAAKETAELMKSNTEGKTAALVNLLGQVASAREAEAKPLPPESHCAHYDVETGIASPAVLPAAQ